MNYKLKILCLITSLLTSYSIASADTQIPLFQATSDAYQGSIDVSLAVDVDSNATRFIYTENGKENAVSLSNLPTGIVLAQLSGKNVAVLSSPNFSSVNGGSLKLRYLNNGLQDTYKNFDFALARQGQNWNAYIIGANGVPQNFTRMYLIAKKLLGNVIGIDRITVK